MAISLEELKRQREQIQQHLAWLDAKIAELDKTEGDEPVKTEAAPLESPKPEVSTDAPEETSEDTAKETTAEPEAKPAVLEPDPNAPVYKAKTQGELRRAQIGCVALFALSTALFLFLLFGLPYLLD